MTPCPFCQPAPSQIFHQGQHIMGLWEACPQTPGHALLVTRRHLADWFAATPAEQAELWAAATMAREAILRHHQPSGFHIGFEVGEGQRIAHLHLHIIPRYQAATPRLTTGMQHDHLLPQLHYHFDRARQVDIAVSFVLDSGVRQLEQRLGDLLERQGRLRLITGDYLGVTDTEALLRLLDLQQRYPDQVELRVFEARLQGFHPKAYLVVDNNGERCAFVGSSNLSGAALKEAVEWNYRLTSDTQEVEQAFLKLLEITRELTPQWVDAYRARRQPPVLLGGASLAAERSVAVEVVKEEQAPPPTPNPVQILALEALQNTRAAGNRAGLVVLATGLGKTFLAAFDSQPYRRVLFVAHRQEILAQAMQAFRRVRPSDHMGLYHGTEKTPDAQTLFASIQTLGRLPNLRQFHREAFDYVVVDEFHHAHAGTYRKLLDHFQPRFMLGLTATPERTDGGDLLALCGQNLVFRCDLVEGVRRQLLCPFHYFGVPDLVDYRNIPWRNGRWDPDSLDNAVIVESRAQNALDNLRRHGGARCLAFCCSVRHARFTADFLTRQGVRAAAVYSGPDSAPRSESLDRLARGDLDVLCCVDMFNEGVDLPAVDTVLMLRPTESRILWLQQFGRGLRQAQGKCLKVIDYIGNHRTFLLKPLTLFDLGPGDRELARCFELLRAGGRPELPPGCEATYSLEALDLLQSLLRLDRGQALLSYYQEFDELHGRRPCAVEAHQDRYSPRSAKGWLDFVRDQGGLTPAELSALASHAAFLGELEKTTMVKSYKMLLLQAMLNLDAFPGSVDIAALSAEFARLAGRSARLRADVSVSLDDAAAVRSLVRKNPGHAWTGGWTEGRAPFFRVAGDNFETVFQAEGEQREALQALTRELVDWRMAEYLDRPGATSGEFFECSVSQTQSKPILFLPDRAKVAGIPLGRTPVKVEDEMWEANLVKVAVNVMRRAGSQQNELPALLRRWFGPDAGQPGTRHRVTFRRDGDHWVMAPVGPSTG